MLKTTTIVLVAAVAVGGCANPILAVDAPGSSVARSPAPQGTVKTMDDAQKQLDHLRAKYYEAIRDQVGATQDTSSGLIWLGTLVAGLAAGNAHRDTILYPALIGGTAYGLSRASFDGRRLQVWTEGIKALDCAREATIPLNLGATEPLLRLRLQELSKQIVDTTTARDNLSALIGSSPLPSEDLAPARDLVVSATAALDAAKLTEAGAAGLLDASQGLELSAKVNNIQLKVTEAMSNFTINPADVKRAIEGLGGFVGMLAPGAGLETFIQAAVAKYELKPQSGESEALKTASENLKAKLQGLADKQATVKALTRNVDVAAVSAGYSGPS